MLGSETDEDIVEKSWTYLQDWFGISPEAMQDFELFERSDSLWIRSTDVPDRLDAQTDGFRLLRFSHRGIKPTTYGLQFLGDRINKNQIRVSRDELMTLLNRDMIPRERNESGYVAIIYEERIIGCGYYQDELVSSRIPKGRSKQLRDYLEDGPTA